MKILKNISFGLLIVVAVLLAVTTIIEAVKGTGFVQEYIYNSYIFIILWGALTAFSLAYLLKRKRYKNPLIFLIHIAFVVILLGALTTWTTSIKGRVYLQEKQKVSTFTDEDENTVAFPFEVALQKFTIINYSATQTPQDFCSELVFLQKDKAPFFAKVSMNNIVSYKGYRFYQSGYDEENKKGTFLSISYDPYGVGITYFGYGLLLFSLIVFFFGKQSEFYKLLRNPLLKNMTVFCFILLGTFNLNAKNQVPTPKVLSQEEATQFCDLYVLYNGRVSPLQTLAKDFTVKLYGKDTYEGYSAEQVFTGWLFYYGNWIKQPMVKIKSANVQNLLEIDSKYATFEDFFSVKRRYKLYDKLVEIYRGKEVADKKGIREADEKYNLIAMLRLGKLMKIFPHKSAEGIVSWYASNERLPQNIDSQKKVFIGKSIGYLLEKVKAKNTEEFSQFCKKIKTFQEKELGKENLPNKKRFQAEKIYNKVDYSKHLFKVFLLIGLVAFAYFMYCLITRKTVRKSVLWALNSILILGLLYLSVFIALRGYVSQHFPVSNGYEIMQFLAWASLLVVLFLQFKFRIVLPFGFLLSGLTLLVATLGQSSPKITLLMPVLASPLLSIHVVTIMISYLLFAFVMFNGLTGILLHFFTKNCDEQIKRLQIISQIMLYPAVFLLTIGIFIGAVWANVSWGRYWGWDPKEVWALVTMLIYSLPIHSVSIKQFQKPLFFHIFTVLAFFAVLFTYFGVNFVLGGMHSYAGG